jgi:hypothetical protein
MVAREPVYISDEASTPVSGKTRSISYSNTNTTNNNDEDAIEDYEESLSRRRAQSDHLSYGADTKNFFNRERIISDPRGLNVDNYVRKYQVNGGRKTKRFQNSTVINRLYRYGRMKRADFSFTSLSAALKTVDIEMNSIIAENQENPLYSKEEIVEKTAVRKIEIWYLIMSPRKKLMTRLIHRNIVSEILYSVIDQAYNIGQIRYKRRANMLKSGAAIKIQKLYKGWIQKQVDEEFRVEMEERQRVTDRFLNVWVGAVKNGIRLYRYLKWLIKKKIIRKTPPLVTSGAKLKAYYTVSIPRVVEGYVQLLSVYKKFELKVQLRKNRFLNNGGNNAGANGNAENNTGRRVRVFREYGNAVVIIQSVFRAYMQRKRFMATQRNQSLMVKLTMFLTKAMRKRRKLRAIKQNESVTKIQRYVRGNILRRKIYNIVHAGLTLNFVWRKYVAYKSLKSQLRRVDRPYTIILHGLRDLPKKYLTSDQIRVKLSVWWHPLLHIVSSNDFTTILQSKQPQYIYLSVPFKVLEPVVNEENGNKPATPNSRSDNTFYHGDRTRHPSPLKSLIQRTPFGSIFGGPNNYGEQNGYQPAGYNPFTYGRKNGTGPVLPLQQQKPQLTNSHLKLLPSSPIFTASFRKKIIPDEKEEEEENKKRKSTSPNHNMIPPLSASFPKKSVGGNHHPHHHHHPPGEEEKKEEEDKNNSRGHFKSMTSPDSKSKPLSSESSSSQETTSSSNESSPQKRKNSKKRSLRSSQNILPPSSLLNLALFEEENEDYEDDSDDGGAGDQEVAVVAGGKQQGEEEIEDGAAGFSPTKDQLRPRELKTEHSMRSLQSSSSADKNSPMSSKSNNPMSPTTGRRNSQHRNSRLSILTKSPSKGSQASIDIPSTSARSRVPSIFQSLQSAFSRPNHQNPIIRDSAALYKEGSPHHNQNQNQSIFQAHGDEQESSQEQQTSNPEERKRSFLFSGSNRPTGAGVMRSTINFALKLRSMVQKTQASPVKLDCVCNFDETVIKIPGCHGNSVFKFEILEGE